MGLSGGEGGANNMAEGVGYIGMFTLEKKKWGYAQILSLQRNDLFPKMKTTM